MKRILFTAVLLLSSGLNSGGAYANGNNSLNSELGHFSGGVLSSGAITALSHYYLPQQNRRWNGFWLPTAVSTLAEFREYSVGDNTAGEALLDASAFAVGAMLGSLVTDKYLLAPVVKNEAEGGRFVGVNLAFSF
ncbi:hypothetical protein KDN34_01745 [Shewanella yunxiaonensis]|uniref:Uncharacterized protein n=1 Tax=Shewanella yunxiaonensis TaxID=2829809 RepID=A0ABX7YUA2_9GAMM|nr:MULTISPECIES: hypothetical protein [Shewanella]MDF0534967.1 hypothetical protein [Shewanella sp. A32]QUN06220.1 hypothetical protein KDN34_01745 [Shewanella yunxiaonensis]